MIKIPNNLPRDRWLHITKTFGIGEDKTVISDPNMDNLELLNRECPLCKSVKIEIRAYDGLVTGKCLQCGMIWVEK